MLSQRETAEIRLNRYASLARPLLQRFIKPECRQSDCIAATRMSCAALQALGVKTEPLAVTWIVQANFLQFAFVCGLRGAAKNEALRTAASYTRREVPGGVGWDGHLVLIAEDRWLVDPSFDQCAAHPELDIPPTILLVDLQSADCHPRDCEIRLGLTTDKGIALTVTYQPLAGEDAGWRESEAWNEPELEIAGKYIARAILRAK